MPPFTLVNLLYKTRSAVVIVHHRVRQLGNFKLFIELLHRSNEICWSGGALPPRFQGWRGATRAKAPVFKSRHRRQRWNCEQGSTCLRPLCPSPSLPPSSSACSRVWTQHEAGRREAGIGRATSSKTRARGYKHSRALVMSAGCSAAVLYRLMW